MVGHEQAEPESLLVGKQARMWDAGHRLSLPRRGLTLPLDDQVRKHTCIIALDDGRKEAACE